MGLTVLSPGATGPFVWTLNTGSSKVSILGWTPAGHNTYTYATSDVGITAWVTMPANQTKADISVTLSYSTSLGQAVTDGPHVCRVWQQFFPGDSVGPSTSQPHSISFSSNPTGGRAPYTFDWVLYTAVQDPNTGYWFLSQRVAEKTQRSGSFDKLPSGNYVAIPHTTDTPDSSDDPAVQAKPHCRIEEGGLIPITI